MNHSLFDANEFQDSALKALDAIERPCELILTRESLFSSALKPCTDDCAPPTGLPPPAHPDLINSPREIRPFSRSSSSRHRLVRNPNSNVKLLFIRNTVSSPEACGTTPLPESNMHIARIECPECGRWDFFNLQGFLNHCRIRHQREYGSHDECIRECSALVTSSEQDWVLQNGTEITGVGIPSLRRLFEIAVGKRTSLFPTLKREPSSDQDKITLECEGDASAGGPEIKGTHLSRTLGVHQETPALAAILGGRAARRQIRVFNEDEPVDIENNDNPQKTNKRWKAKYSHRNLARSELEVNLDLTSGILLGPLPPVGSTGGRSKDLQGVILGAGTFESTRFHITCRIAITDRSRWLPPGKYSSLSLGSLTSW